MEGKVEENTKSKSKNRNLKNENSLGDFGDNMKYNNICIIKIKEGEKKEQGIKNLLEKIMIENFSNLERGKAMQVQEAQRVPIKMNPKRPTRRHTIIKMASFKDKERILKEAREKQLVTYKGAPISVSADFLTETL